MRSLQNALEPGILEDLLKVLIHFPLRIPSTVTAPLSTLLNLAGVSKALLGHHSFELLTAKFEKALENNVEHPPFHRQETARL